MKLDDILTNETPYWEDRCGLRWHVDSLNTWSFPQWESRTNIPCVDINGAPGGRWFTHVYGPTSQHHEEFGTFEEAVAWAIPIYVRIQLGDSK